MEIEKMRNPS